MKKKFVDITHYVIIGASRVFVAFVAFTLVCSCSPEHKAERFIKKLERDCNYLFSDINENSAYVYYAKNNKYYKHDVNTKQTSAVFKLKNGVDTYIYDNCSIGKGDVFYHTSQGDVFRHNLISNKEECISKYGGKQIFFVGCWHHNILFYDASEEVNCDKKVIKYNADILAPIPVKFNDIDESCKNHFVPALINGTKGCMVILQPYNIEDGMDLSYYLYFYDFQQNKNGKLNLLCLSDNVRVDGEGAKRVVVAQKDYSTMVMYDVDGNLKKEFPTIYGWPSHRGLTSGNIITKSEKYNLLCYIANDDNALVSSIYLYYYDGNSGEEVKINKYTNANGEEVMFTMGESSRRNIHATKSGNGLVFYGGTDFLNEMALFYFDFETKSIKIIDRGSFISFEKGLYKVEHHNGSIGWYNTNGQASEPRSIFYDMGASIWNW